MSVINVEQFNMGDERQFANLYYARYKKILAYANYKTHNGKLAATYTDIAFKKLKDLNPKKFTSISQILYWLKGTIETISIINCTNMPAPPPFS